jgi:hypothetical protein
MKVFEIEIESIFTSMKLTTLIFPDKDLLKFFTFSVHQEI